MSSPSPDQLRRRYSDYSDEALLAAHGVGSSGYTPTAWQIIAEEVAARRLTPAEAPAEAPSLTLPASAPLTTVEAAGLVLRSLNDGAKASRVHRLLVDGGLPSADASLIVDQTVLTWRRDAETAITRALLHAGLWCGGGVAITALTWLLATPGGGTYIVAYGPVLYGGVRVVATLGRLGAVKRQCDLPDTITASEG